MKNPWEEIALEDYEAHMQLDSVMQLQALSAMMKGQFDAYPVSEVMILGIAGGNGLEHVEPGKFRRICGVDVNAEYLKAAQERYPGLAGTLQCLCMDLTQDAHRLPRTELLLADLLVEYIGYACFQSAVMQAEPRYVSCIIQINCGDGWVSDSPYLHAFDGLESVHCQMDEQALVRAMEEIGYGLIKTLERELPNGKKLVQLDFECAV